MSASVVPDGLSVENAPLSPKPHLTEAKPVRRRYSREEKLRILRLVDTCAERGQVAAILRREGIYYSTLNDFRKQQQQGRLETKTERTKLHNHDNDNELARLRRENARLQHKLEKAELIIDVQKKVSQLLGLTMTIQTDVPEP